MTLDDILETLAPAGVEATATRPGMGAAEEDVATARQLRRGDVPLPRCSRRSGGSLQQCAVSVQQSTGAGAACQ